MRVLLLESGGEGIEREVEQLNGNATVSGLPYPLQASRLRYIGGTTNHWSGHCYRFLDRDFAARPGIPNTGWPIALADVAGYLPEASKRVLFRRTPSIGRRKPGVGAWRRRDGRSTRSCSKLGSRSSRPSIPGPETAPLPTMRLPSPRRRTFASSTTRT